MYESQVTARNVGILYIVGTVAGILSLLLTVSIFSSPEYLEQIQENKSRVITAVLLVLIMGFSLAMIPVLLFPILKVHNYTLALGAVIFRGALETVGYIAISICWLLLITLSDSSDSSDVHSLSDVAHYKLVGSLLLGSIDRISQISVFVFSVGALMMNYIFYYSKLIPQWLSLWGLVGAVMYLSVPLLGFVGFILEILYVPLAVQEMVLALWLILKGFNQLLTPQPQIGYVKRP